MESKFSERLDELMFENKVSAKTLGSAISVSKVTIYRYLSEVHSPDFTALIALADFFKCSLDFLLGLTDSNLTVNFSAPPPFDERFKYLLKHFNTTEYFLSKDTGMSRSMLFMWLSGERLPQSDSLVKLSNYFNCTVDFIVGRE